MARIHTRTTTPAEFLAEIAGAVASMNEAQAQAFHLHGVAMAMAAGVEPADVMPLIETGKLAAKLRYLAEVQAGVHNDAAGRRAVLRLLTP